MSSDKPRGLGKLNWLPDRSQAEASLYQPSGESSEADDTPPTEADENAEETAVDQPKRQTRKAASKKASESRSAATSMEASEPASKKGGQQKVTPAVVEEAPPPPGRTKEARVQFNHRVLMDRHEILDRYKTQHGATWQAIVDQMVDEYLTRRGLLSDDE